MSKRRYPPQDYGPLFTPEQIEAIRKARHQGDQEPGDTTTDTNKEGTKK